MELDGTQCSIFEKLSGVWKCGEALFRSIDHEKKYTDLGLPKVQLHGQVDQSTIKLTQEKEEVRFEFCNFTAKFSVHCLASCEFS